MLEDHLIYVPAFRAYMFRSSSNAAAFLSHLKVETKYSIIVLIFYCYSFSLMHDLPFSLKSSSLLLNNSTYLEFRENAIP